MEIKQNYFSFILGEKKDDASKHVQRYKKHVFLKSRSRVQCLSGAKTDKSKQD